MNRAEQAELEALRGELPDLAATPSGRKILRALELFGYQRLEESASLDNVALMHRAQGGYWAAQDFLSLCRK